ncbi:alpha/beta hydrolase [bacterium]|jgi:pimeloyl-ACP methyl ester carboxylesterase|nr:alpha/beta hydrolase [bacterium]
MKKYIKKYVEIPSGEKIAYLEEGKGDKVLVLLHGNMSSSIHWTPLIEKLEHDYKIYAPDFRGLGDSSYNKPFDSLEELGEDIKAFCDKLAIKKAAFAGWSAGGGVVLYLAATYPKLVKQVLLVNSMSYRGYPVYKKDANGQVLLGQVYKSKEEMALDPVQVLPVQTAIEAKNYELMENVWNFAIYSAGRGPSPEDGHIYLTETLKQRCLIDVDWALANFNMSDKHNGYNPGNGLAAKVTCPIVSYWGEKDITVPSYMALENKEGFKQLEFVVIKDSGHSPIIDQTDFLAQSFKEHLK